MNLQSHAIGAVVSDFETVGKRLTKVLRGLGVKNLQLLHLLLLRRFLLIPAILLLFGWRDG